MFKKIPAFLIGFLSGIVVSAFAVSFTLYWLFKFESNYEPDWMPDFESKVFESATELAAAKDNYKRWVALNEVSLWAIEAGAIERAEQYAKESLGSAELYKDDWNYGNAIHKANIALGRIALRRGDIILAKEQLLLAGNTPGSPS